MAVCNKCGKGGLEWKTTSGGKLYLEIHNCIQPKNKKPTNKPVFGMKKEPINILYGATLTNEALENGLEEELGL